ncbi:hypothetical protein [Bacillus sp. FJAT-29814]|uniref:hypothetical protein n=1 Tax=Bacillus sp. FJAT-29814 TaxID=1729688 RepID=UPI000834F3EF|nr:hypothetical protein [Bacillus sp. FJAT-29814]
MATKTDGNEAKVSPIDGIGDKSGGNKSKSVANRRDWQQKWMETKAKVSPITRKQVQNKKRLPVIQQSLLIY